jgi:hypothetical protein
MVFDLFLAALAGLGACALEKRFRHGRLLVLLAGATFLVEASPMPLPLNVASRVVRFRTPEARVHWAFERPGIYVHVEALPPDAVLVEFPFGEGAYDVRYMFYSIGHWRRLVNGYSGLFPRDYAVLARVLGAVPNDAPGAFETLIASGATHAVVHEAAYRHDAGPAVSAWLELHGARRMAQVSDDVLFSLPR